MTQEEWAEYDARFDPPKREPMWKPDGWEYVDCYRCGRTEKISATALYGRDGRVFCDDCNHPDFLAPFRDDWSWK